VELRQLRYAVAVADHLNFREASRALHVAQPSLSVQIKQLEEEIGVALFIRSKRHVEITRPGKVFLKTAREALAMLDRSVSSALGQSEAKWERFGYPTSTHSPSRYLSR
jgi:DNA-binding transcriptional LysR family regulator